MKFRIQEYENGTFKLQRRCLRFWWLDYSGVIHFSLEEAKQSVEYLLVEEHKRIKGRIVKRTINL